MAFDAAARAQRARFVRYLREHLDTSLSTTPLSDLSMLYREGNTYDTMSEHPTASWEPLQDGNVFYRRQQVYSIPGKLPNLGDYIIAGCHYGGPIGIHLSFSNAQAN